MASLGRVARRALGGQGGLATFQQAGARSFAAVPDTSTSPDAPVNSIDGKVLHPDLLNENFRTAQYAVRGELYLKAQELVKQGKDVIMTNIGNPQALGQKPITFNRQVHALVTAPFLMDDPKLADAFPPDAVARAKKLLGKKYFNGSIGAYTDSRGAAGVRADVAKYIEQRDGKGVSANPDHIFLTDGASVAVRMLLNAIIRDSRDAIMVPVPQYPLYSAGIQLYGGTLQPYYLDEENKWALNLDHMQAQVDAARADGKAVRALVFINPGNPSGACLSEGNLKELIEFAHREKLVLMADEVYLENVYQDARPFVSAKSVLAKMGEPYSSSLELISFMTVSKGSTGECGLRGGWFEATNLLPETLDELYKVASINMCPNTQGQLSVQLLVEPPAAGDPSHDQYRQERGDIIASLRRRAQMVTDAFNSLEGVTCNFTEGAMYSFPQLRLPQKAVEAAQEAGKAPDVFYCLRLLEATGISTVPGSGFGQQEGTLHLRTTILPPEDQMADFCSRFKKFHEAFMDEYR